MAGALAALMPPDEDESVDEYIQIEPLEGEIQTEEDEDGGLLIHLPGEAEDRSGKANPNEFYANLADGIVPDSILSSIANDLLRKIEIDRDARKKRDEQYEEGLKRSGLGKDAPGGADFDGASRVVHPGLAQACIDFRARIMKEMWPPSGPVKAKILGEVTKEKDDRAKRKVEFMNYQLTTLMREARPVMDTTMTQVPLGGSQFIRLWWDGRRERPRMQFTPVDRVYIPDNAEDFVSAHRRTFVDYVTQVEFHGRVESGMYRETKGPAPAFIPEKSKSEKANEKIEGKEGDVQNIDGDREIYEVMSYLEVSPQMAEHLKFEEEGDLLPYLISIDKGDRRVLAIYRDWEPDDKTHEPIEHLFEFPFIPWRGALSVGLPHIIGGLSGSATGALRALLDSAQIANTQGGLVLKGAGVSGQNVNPQWGTFQEIGSALETDDIRKKVMPFATKEPSGILFQLLQFVDAELKGAVRTSLDETAIDTNANTPVGTQLSRVEEGLVVFSAIHGAIHYATNRLLTGLHRLNKLHLPPVIQVGIDGKEIFVKRSDFQGSMDIMPVSDPTIYSDQQRMAQINAIQQRAAMVPGLYKTRAVEERFLKLMKVPNASELLTDQPQPHELNAVNENLAMAFGRPVVAFPEQEHLAHIQVHLDFLVNPMLGANPIIEPKFLPSALQHIAEHIVYFYVRMNTDTVSRAAGVHHAGDLMGGDDALKAQFDKLLALTSQHVTPQMKSVFQNVLPVLQQAMQKMQQYMPKPPMDPAMVAGQTAQAETARKTQADQGNLAIKSKQLDQTAAAQAARNQNDQVRNAVMADRNEVQRENSERAEETRIRTTAMDNDTAEQISADRIAVGRTSGFKNGESLTGAA